MLNQDKHQGQADLLKVTMETGGIKLIPDVRIEVRRLLKQLFIACVCANAEVKKSDE